MNAHKTLSISLILKTLLLFSLLTFIVAACGTSAGANAGATQPKPTPATVQKCGTINIMPGGIGARNVPVNANTDGSGSCFWQAFQQCRSASLTVSFGSVDTVTIHTFSLQKKNADCTISDAVQHRVIPRPAGNVATYTCSGLAKVANELRFNSCGISGNVTVPIDK